MNGYAATRRIRQTAWRKNMNLIALTDWGQEGDRAKSRAAGFDHHFVQTHRPPVIDEIARRAAAEFRLFAISDGTRGRDDLPKAQNRRPEANDPKRLGRRVVLRRGPQGV